MRNLKRVLSLTLASVMLLGMMVVGSAAAGYDDVSKDDNVEAIEVLQAIEVMVGDERGFGPERPVNRAEMAVVMGKLLSLDYNYYTALCPFTDVYDWAQGWVGACYANKIVSGRGDGIYDPSATVTAVEAASMLMRALGYFQYQNDYTDGFELATVTQGKKIGIFDNVGSSASEPMTRNQVAQMVLNALQSAVVEPDGNTINLTTPDGSVITGKVNYVSVTSSKSYATAISRTTATSIGSQNTGYIVELGERLYDGALKLNEYTTDAFQRPARHWEYDGKEIGTYAKYELLRQEYTQKVTGKDLYDLLTKATIEDYDFTIAVDGETAEAVLKNSSAPNAGKNGAWFTKGNLVRTNTEAVGATGDGVLTQVFVDPDEGDGTVYIAIINTYLAKAVDDYNEKKDEATYTVWSLKDGDTTSRVGLVKDTTEKIDLDVKGEDFDIEDVQKDDVVLVHVAEGEIKEIIDPEVIDDTTISAFKRADWVNADGTQYDYANSVQYDDDVLDYYDNTNMKDTNYRLFLDEYGYMIGIEILEDPNEYVFLTGIDLDTSNLSNKTADGFIIHTDGTEATVKINMDKSKNAQGKKFSAGDEQFGSDYVSDTDNGTGVGSLMNTWCRFTVDSNGTYTLFEVPNTTDTWENEDGEGNPNVKGNNSRGKAAQGRNHSEEPNTNSGRGEELLELNKSHIYLNSEISGFTRVYTNDDTVFITAETTQITATNAWKNDHTPDNRKTAVIINGVDSIITGAANVNLKAWDATRVKDQASPNYTADDRYTSNGVYTLFDKDGYVIAAIVVGEDDGTTTSFAFVTSGDMEQESYSPSDDIYTWTRKVIINGEEAVLTEKTDTDPYIANVNANNGSMNKGYWAEVKYDGNGDVRSVTNLSTHTVVNTSIKCPNKDFDTLYSGDNKYIYSIADVEAATDDKNTVLLWDNLVDEGKYVSVEGSTLQVRTDTGDKDGFAIDPSCKTVLIQDGEPTINDPKYMDSINYYSGGTSGAKRAVDRLEKNNAFVGFIGAVLENGRATSIIIYDKSAYSINQGTGTTTTPTGDYPVVDRNGSNFLVRYYDANFGTNNAMKDAAIQKFAEEQVAAYFGVTVKASSWNLLDPSQGTVYLDDGTLIGTSVGVRTQRVVKVSLDGQAIGYVDAGVALGAGALAGGFTKLNSIKSDKITTGDYLVNALGADTNNANNITVHVGTAGTMNFNSVPSTQPTFQRDANVYTQVAVTLANGSGITITSKDTVADASATTGNLTYTKTEAGSDVTVYVAKDKALTVQGGQAGDGTRHALTATTASGPSTINSKVTAAAGPAADDVSGTYTPTETVTLNETVGEVEIHIKLSETQTETISVNSSTTIGAIAGHEKINLRESNYGEYLVDISADAATDGTQGTEIDSGDSTSVAVRDGATYEFGYYKVTRSGGTDNANFDITWKNGNAALGASDIIYVKANSEITATVAVKSAGITATASGATLEIDGTLGTSTTVKAAGADSVKIEDSTGNDSSASVSVDANGGVNQVKVTGMSNTVGSEDKITEGTVTFTIKVVSDSVTGVYVKFNQA